MGLIESVGIDEALKRTAVKPTASATVRETVERYCGSRSPDTARRYRNEAERHIYPVLGGMEIQSLGAEDVQTWLNGLDLAGKTVTHLHAVLHASLAAAIDRGELTVNPARKSRRGGTGVRLPRRQSGRQHVFLSREEQAQAIAALPEHYRPLGQFLFDSGLRIGEALALTPADICNGKVTVNKSVSRSYTGGDTRPFVVGPTKTESSERTIPVPGLDQLDLSHEYVFVNERGERLHYETFRRSVWRKAMASSGLPPHRRPTIHDCRHTHASRLLDSGIPILAVSRRLGHASISVTLGTYAHVANDADARILAVLAS